MRSFAADVTIRVKPRGGPVRDSARTRPRQTVQSHVVMLVHGYNVDLCAACRSYTDFQRSFAKWPAARRWPLVRVFWPGDAAWGPFKIAAYPFKPQTAKDSADRLVTVLRKLRGPRGRQVQVSLVGHSLGCRVVLEALDRLTRMAREDPSASLPQIHAVCLMAAAVPVHEVDKDGSLHETCKDAKHTLFLYSPDDLVLRFAFPLGQTGARLFGERNVYLRAVGLHGKPERFPTYRRRVFKQPGKGAGHGDYWSSRIAAEDVARYLGDAVAHRVPARTLERHALAERTLSRWQVDRRQPTGTLAGGLCDGC